MRFRKYFLFILIIGALVAPVFSVRAEDGVVDPNKLPTVYLFHGEECPHCQAEIAFFEDLKKELPNLEIKEFEVWHNKKNRKLFLEVVKKMEADVSSVPFTIIGNQYLVGFDKAETTGVVLRKEIEALRGIEIDSAIESILKGEEVKINPNNITKLEDVNIPLLGKINLKTISLPVLSAVLGLLDGFNPCSMWALLVLLTLLINTGSRKKVWLVGGVFIGVSALSYFLFMSAWLNAFVFAGYLAITRIIIGIVALVAGVISIKEFYTFKPNVCEVSSEEDKQKTMNRIEKAMELTSLPLIILGVAGIAFSVNLVELMCSLGIPVVFTKTLSIYILPGWKYYFYIAFYVFFYMLDDIIVLSVAGFSMKFLSLNDKYARWSRLIAGVLMLLLGAIFLLKPEILMFG